MKFESQIYKLETKTVRHKISRGELSVVLCVFYSYRSLSPYEILEDLLLLIRAQDLDEAK